MARDVRLGHPIHVGAAPAYGWQDITTDRTVMLAGLDRVLVAFNADACPRHRILAIGNALLKGMVSTRSFSVRCQ